MPKSSKHKKEKAADFSASIVLPNQRITTHGDFAEPTTKRNLTIHDLLAQLKHYNTNVRNEAILGLRELLDANWYLVDPHLSTLLNALVRLIGDEDASVRKQLLTFMSWLLPRVPAEDLLPHSSTLLLFATSAQTHIFPEIRIDAVRFIDIFLDTIPSATTSGWYDKTQEKHGNRVLNGYLGILSAGTKFGDTEGPMKATSTASVTLTPASKLVVLRSLCTFLNHALAFDQSLQQQRGFESTLTQSPNCWFMKDDFSSPEAHARFEHLFDPSPSTSTTNSSADAASTSSSADVFGFRGISNYAMLDRARTEDSGPWTLQDLDDVAGEDESSKDNQPSGHNALTEFVTHLSNVLRSTLIDTYLDFAPSVFSPSTTPSETETNLVLTVCRIVKVLYHVVFRQTGATELDPVHVEHLESIVGYMHPYFPAHPRDHKIDQLFEEFNLIFCELTSLLVKANSNLTGEGSRSLRRRRLCGPQQRQRPQQSHTGTAKDRRKYRQSEKQVTRYILDRLRNSTPGRESSGGGGAGSGGPLTPTAYLALMPSIWMIINRRPGARFGTAANGDASADDDDDDEHRQRDVLSATLDHALKITSKSACKRLTIEFISRLIMVSSEPSYQGHFRIERGGAAGAVASPSPSLGLEIKAKIDAWILHLPQVLWELGSSQLRTTEIILRTLLRFLQRQTRTTPDQVKMMGSLQARLLPYFEIKHPSRGILAGPYSKLPPVASVSDNAAADVVGMDGKHHRVRYLVLDVVKTLSSFAKAEDDPMRGGTGVFASAVRDAVMKGEERTYLNYSLVMS